MASIAEWGWHRYRGNEATLVGSAFAMVCEWLCMWEVSYSHLLV